MGFTTGFTGGVTLTLGLAYLTVLTHERKRQAQAQHLRLQSHVLNSLLEPAQLPLPQTRAELAHEERGSLVDTAKDRWNEEVENAVRWVQRTDWNEVREGMEGTVSRLLAGGLQKSREGVGEAEKQARPHVQEAVDTIKASLGKGADQAAVGVDKTAASTIAVAEKAGGEVKAGAGKIAASAKTDVDSAINSTKSRLNQAGMKTMEYKEAAKAKEDHTVADVKSGVQTASDLISSSGGTVNVARGAVRDAISKGIERGQEAIGKAQAAVGLAVDKMESKGQSSTLSHSSAVEKALHERYEKPNGLDKSAEEVWAERYKPIDSRDNSVLRGV